MNLTGGLMTEYGILISGSAEGYLEDSLYELTRWFGAIPLYWIVGGVVLFVLLLKKVLR